MTGEEQDIVLLQILCMLGSQHLLVTLEDAMTKAGTPIYNSGGGSLNTLGRLEVFFGYRERYTGPDPLGPKGDGQHAGNWKRGQCHFVYPENPPEVAP